MQVGESACIKALGSFFRVSTKIARHVSLQSYIFGYTIPNEQCELKLVQIGVQCLVSEKRSGLDSALRENI